MIEFDVDMGYLLEDDELDCVVLNDEAGEHEPMEFVPKLRGGTCKWNLVEKWPNAKGDDHVYGYETECGHRHTWWPDTLPSYCPSCGRRVDK